MKNFIDKIFFRSNNLDYVSQSIKDLTNNTSALNIFEAIKNKRLAFYKVVIRKCFKGLKSFQNV